MISWDVEHSDSMYTHAYLFSLFLHQFKCAWNKFLEPIEKNSTVVHTPTRIVVEFNTLKGSLNDSNFILISIKNHFLPSRYIPGFT